MNVVAPPATFWPAAVATGLATVMCVESGMFVTSRATFVTVPSALVRGMGRLNPSWNDAVLETATVAVFDSSRVTVACRGGQVAASHSTHDYGRFSTPFC